MADPQIEKQNVPPVEIPVPQESAQPAPTMSQTPKKLSLPKLKMPPINFPVLAGRKRLLIALSAVAVLLLLGILVLTMFVGRGQNGQGATPTPTPAQEPSSDNQGKKETKYSSDPEVNKIEEDSRALEQSLSGVEVREDNLRVPTTDFNISF